MVEWILLHHREATHDRPDQYRYPKLNLVQDRLLGLQTFQQLHPQSNHYVEDEWLYDKLTDVFLPNRMVPEIKDRYDTVVKMDKSNSAQNKTKDYINLVNTLMDVDKNLNIPSKFNDALSLTEIEPTSVKIDPMVPVVPSQPKPKIIDRESIKIFEQYQAKIKNNHDLCPKHLKTPMYSPYFHYKKDCTFISTQNAKELIKKTLGAIDPHYESLLVKQIQDFNKNFKGKQKDSSPPNRTTSTSSGSHAGAYAPYQGEFLQPHHPQFINPQSFQGRGRGRGRFIPQQYPNIKTLQQLDANFAYQQGLLEGAGLTQNQPKRKFSQIRTEQDFRKKRI
jgi:hypothetical protein